MTFYGHLETNGTKKDNKPDCHLPWGQKDAVPWVKIQSSQSLEKCGMRCSKQRRCRNQNENFGGEKPNPNRIFRKNKEPVWEWRNTGEREKHFRKWRSWVYAVRMWPEQTYYSNNKTQVMPSLRFLLAYSYGVFYIHLILVNKKL